jgi:hypothetical protein
MGALADAGAWSTMLVAMVPLVICALSVALTFERGLERGLRR